MKKSIRLLVLLCFMMLILVGCKDMKEIDRILFPVVLGIDWDEENSTIKIYIQVATSPTQSNSQSQSPAVYNVLEGAGKTLKEAMKDLIDHAQEYVSWKQILAVVFTDKVAKKGIAEELDVLCRNEQIHLNSYLIITTENLRDLLGTAPVIRTGLPTTIAGVSLVSKQSTHSKAVTIKDFIVDNLNQEKEPILPQISIERKEETQKEEKIVFKYKGLGVFRAYNLIGWLDEKETTASLFVSGIKTQGYISLFQSRNTGDGDITVSEITTKTKFTPYMQNNKPGITLKISVEYDIYSYFTSKKMNIAEVKKINGLVESHIKEEVEGVVDKAQHKFKADIFGFGGEIYRKYPKYWLENKKDWPEIFSTMDVNVEVEGNLRDTGQLTNSFRVK